VWTARGVGPDGITSFNIVQLASDSGNAAALVFFLFDLLFLDGEDRTVQPLIERKERLALYWLTPSDPCITATIRSARARIPRAGLQGLA
jgi:ATP-dependent DNA ligase